MSDRGHELTDELLAKLEAQIRREYARAYRDTKLKLEKYLDKIEEGRKEQAALLQAGKITPKEYNDWVFRHTEYDTVYSCMKYTNTASRATAAANGMKKVKEYPDPKNTVYCAYAITRREWETLKQVTVREPEGKDCLPV